MPAASTAGSACTAGNTTTADPARAARPPARLPARASGPPSPQLRPAPVTGEDGDDGPDGKSAQPVAPRQATAARAAPRRCEGSGSQNTRARAHTTPGPPGARPSVRNGFYRAAHLAALARGYGGAPLPTYPGLPDRLERGPAPAQRPAVSVIVPFHGGRAEARDVLERIDAIALSEQDELLVADNTDGQVSPAKEDLRPPRSSRRRGSTPPPSPAIARRSVPAASGFCSWTPTAARRRT